MECTKDWESIGDGFVTGMAVEVGGVTAQEVAFVSLSEITCTLPTGTGQRVTIQALTFTEGNVQSSGLVFDKIGYAKPQITQLSVSAVSSCATVSSTRLASCDRNGGFVLTLSGQSLTRLPVSQDN